MIDLFACILGAIGGVTLCGWTIRAGYRLGARWWPTKAAPGPAAPAASPAIPQSAPPAPPPAPKRPCGCPVCQVRELAPQLGTVMALVGSGKMRSARVEFSLGTPDGIGGLQVLILDSTLCETVVKPALEAAKRWPAKSMRGAL